MNSPARKLGLLIVAVLLLFVPACGTAGMVQASNIEEILRPVLDRHEQLLTGQLNPATISAEDKITYRRSGYLLMRVLDEATQKPPTPIPPELLPPVPPAPAPTPVSPGT